MLTSSGSRVRREGTIATSSKPYARRAVFPMPISNSMRGCLPGQPVDDVENAERPPRSGWAFGSCMHFRVAPIRAQPRRSGLRGGLLEFFCALGADLFPIDGLGLGQCLVDLRLPRDFEHGDD